MGSTRSFAIRRAPPGRGAERASERAALVARSGGAVVSGLRRLLVGCSLRSGEIFSSRLGKCHFSGKEPVRRLFIFNSADPLDRKGAEGGLASASKVPLPEDVFRNPFATTGCPLFLRLARRFWAKKILARKPGPGPNQRRSLAGASTSGLSLQGSLKDTLCPFETWLFPPK